MSKIRKLLKSFKEAVKKFLWSANNVLTKVKEAIKAFFTKVWNTIVFKEKRDTKKLAGYNEAKEILGIDDNIDIRYDIDLQIEYDRIDETILRLTNPTKLEILKVKKKYKLEISKLKQEKAELGIDDKETINSLNEAIKELKNECRLSIKEIKDKNAETKSIVSPEEQEEIDEQIKNLKHLRNILPPTRAQMLKREKFIKESKGIGKASLYLWPALILLAIFTFYPIVNALRLVFYNGYEDATGAAKYGYTFLGNFIKVIGDANFIKPAAHTKSSALINTLLVAIIQVPATVLISLLIAVALNSVKALKGLFQTIFFLPYVTNSLAIGLVFAFMFKADGGLFNKFLSIFGVDGGAWVSQGTTYWKAIFVLIMFQIWNGLAFKIMVFISAIQGIDDQYYQAAAIDATPKFKQFTRITAPLISPTIFYIVITSFIGALKSYSSVIAIFGKDGIPTGAKFTMKTIVFYIYDFFDNTGNLPEAAAASIILFGIILVMTFVQMQVGKRRVHY